MDHLRKKNNMSKSKKKQDGMDIEEVVDYEHINKDHDFQTVTFDFLEPDHKYQSHLYMLMKKSFSFVTWDIYPLFEAICEQNELGIFLGIASEDEEGIATQQANNKAEEGEIYSVLTVLNFELINKQNFLNSLSKFVFSSAQPESQQFLSSIFLERPEKTGLLINDRVINLPFMVVPNIFDQFMQDKHFIDTEYELEEQYMYNFDFIVYFVPCYSAQPAKKNPDGMVPEQTQHTGGLLYYKQEDKHIVSKAVYSQEIAHKLNDEFRLLMVVLKYEDLLFLIVSKGMFN